MGKNDLMKQILHIISSPRKDQSFSLCLSKAIIKKLVCSDEVFKIVERDLTISEPPMLSDYQISAFYKKANERNEDEKRSLVYSDIVINEIQNSSIIVIGIAMYNLSVSAALKAWIDQIVRVNVSFKWNTDGTKDGLLPGKKVYLAIASGRVHSVKNYEMEFIESYLKLILGSLGINEITTIRIEGTAKKNINNINFNQVVNSNTHL